MLHTGLPEQALGLVVNDKPAEFSCTDQCMHHVPGRTLLAQWMHTEISVERLTWGRPVSEGHWHYWISRQTEPGQRSTGCAVCGYRPTLCRHLHGINLCSESRSIICICNKISLYHHNNHALHLPLIKWGKAFADNMAWTFSDVPEKKSIFYYIVELLHPPYHGQSFLVWWLPHWLALCLNSHQTQDSPTYPFTAQVYSHATQYIKESLNNFFSDAHLGITPSNLNDDFLVWFPMMEFLIFLEKW